MQHDGDFALHEACALHFLDTEGKVRGNLPYLHWSHMIQLS